MSMFGAPTNWPFQMFQEDSQTALSPGGLVRVATAHETLKWGDLVYWTPGGRVGKSLESAPYMCRFVGVVVGGQGMNDQASNDILNISDNAATAGQRVIVQTRGICYVAADATTTIRMGDAITAGRTTAGRARPDMLYSAAATAPGLVIKAGASAITKAANVTQTIIAGLAGTATAANLDMAALAGTVTNAKFNIYVVRVAANGSTVSSAMGTEGTTLNDVLWPTGDPTLVTLGFLIVNPTGTGNFVGGTTALDDATVVPNVKYVDMVRNKLCLGYALQAVTPAAGDAFLMTLDV